MQTLHKIKQPKNKADKTKNVQQLNNLLTNVG